MCDGTQILDGGDDTSVADGWIDILTINGKAITVNGGTIRNWEVVNLNDSNLVIPDITTDEINVCNGSTTLSGNSIVNDGLVVYLLTRLLSLITR